MKTLESAADTQEILTRLASIHPQSRRRWGKMSPSQMICHLSDAYRMALGERTVAPVPFIPRAPLRWFALWVPIPWPHGFPAAPELDQQTGGTRPAIFDHDLSELRAAIERFTTRPREFRWQTHPHFGSMTRKGWMRLGYLHADHHLRQFSA